MAFVAALAAFPYFYNRVDEEIRRRVERKFADHYPDLQVTVRSAKIIEGEGIEVRGLSIVEPGAEGPRAELAHFDELFLHCDADLPELLRHEPQITRITLRRPMFQVTRRPDGTWSTTRLLPLPKFSDEPPVINVENCTVEIFDPLKNPSSTLVCRDANVTITAPPTPAGERPNGDVYVEGFFGGDHLERGEFKGRLSQDGQHWTWSGKVAGLQLSPELRNSLPSGVSEQLELLGALRSRADVDFRLTRDPTRAEPFDFDVRARLERGRIDHPRLPYYLSDVWATVQCTPQRIVVQDFKARNGQCLLEMRGYRDGYATGSPFYLEANCERLLINRELFEAAPEAWRDQWYKFFLTGMIDANLKLRFDGETYHPELVCHCVDTSFTFHKFPYPLVGGRGVITLANDQLAIDIRAKSGAEDISVRGNIANLRTAPGGSIKVTGEKLPLDQKLFDALPGSSQEFVRSLHPQGTFDLDASFMWQPALAGSTEPPVVQRQIVLNLNHCAIRYDGFPYPVYNIRGTIDVANDRWEFRDLRGTNDTGQIGCQGYFSTANGGEVGLRFSGANIALEEELRNALKPHLQQVWNDAQPRGRVQLESDVLYRFSDKHLGVMVRVVPIGETVSIEPSYFRYRFEKLTGAIRFDDGKVTIERLNGRHGDVAISTRGNCELLPGGRWKLTLNDLAVDRLWADRDLYAALPDTLRERLRRLDPQGPMHLRGMFQVTGGGSPAVPEAGTWNIRCDMQQGALTCGLKLEQIYGGVQFEGGFDRQGYHSRAELNVDSLLCRNLQFTNVRGPLWLDSGRVLAGAWAERAVEGRPSRHITAKTLGGTVVADAGLSLAPQTRYQVVASLTDGNLKQLAQDFSVSRQNLNGRVLAQVNLHGTSDGLRSLTGDGRVQLRDATLYELPQMVALLTILSFKPPDTNAFASSDINFRIVGEHIYLDKIDFRGDAISLEGAGEMNFATDVDMRFHAMVGRNEWNVPIISDVFRAASPQIMQIRVGGKLNNPDINRDHFPVVNQALQNLQAGFERPEPALPGTRPLGTPAPTVPASPGAQYPGANAVRPPTAVGPNGSLR